MAGENIPDWDRRDPDNADVPDWDRPSADTVTATVSRTPETDRAISQQNFTLDRATHTRPPPSGLLSWFHRNKKPSVPSMPAAPVAAPAPSPAPTPTIDPSTGVGASVLPSPPGTDSLSQSWFDAGKDIPLQRTQFTPPPGVIPVPLPPGASEPAPGFGGPPDHSALAAGVGGLARGVAPMAAFGAAFGAGSSIGSKVGLGIGAAIPGADVTGIPEAIGYGVGWLIGGTVAGSLAYAGASKAQKKVAEAISPHGIFSEEVEKMQEKEHPLATTIGTAVAGGRPNPKAVLDAGMFLAKSEGRAAIASFIKNGSKLLDEEGLAQVHNVMNIAQAGGLGVAFKVKDQIEAGKFDPKDFATGVGIQLLFNSPWHNPHNAVDAAAGQKLIDNVNKGLQQQEQTEEGGETDASSKPGAAKVGVQPEGGEVGTEAPLRQPGETAATSPGEEPVSPGQSVAPTAQKAHEPLTQAPAKPNAPGTVRLYHGGAGEQAGRDFSPDLGYAQGYADKTEGGKVWYVDVPEGTLKTHDEYGQPMTRVVVPDEIANKAKPLNAPKVAGFTQPQSPYFIQGSGGSGYGLFERGKGGGRLVTAGNLETVQRAKAEMDRRWNAARSAAPPAPVKPATRPLLPMGPKEEPPRVRPPAPTVETPPAPPETSAARPEPEKPSTFSVDMPTDAFGSEQTPVAQFLIGNVGGVVSKSAAAKSGRAKGNPALWDGVPQWSHQTHNKVYNPEGEMPDVAAAALHNAGLISDPSPDTMWKALAEESKSSRTTLKAQKAEAVEVKKQAGQEKKFGQAQRESWKKGKPLVQVRDLQVGDVVTVKDEPLKVIDIDPDTFDVTLENGTKFGVQTVKDNTVIYGEHEPAVTPKLRSGEKAGELFQGADQPFNLAGEAGVDFGARQKKAEAEAAEKTKAAAKQEADQLQLTATKPKPVTRPLLPMGPKEQPPRVRPPGITAPAPVEKPAPVAAPEPAPAAPATRKVKKRYFKEQEEPVTPEAPPVTPKAEPVETVPPRGPTASEKAAPRTKPMSEDEIGKSTRDIFARLTAPKAPGMPPRPIASMTRNEIIDSGREVIRAGVDPDDVVNSNQIPNDQKFAVARAHSEDLRDAADRANQLMRKSNTDENQVNYERTFADLVNWNKQHLERLRTATHAEHPEMDPEAYDPRSYTDMRAENWRKNNRDFTTKERHSAFNAVRAIERADAERAKALDDYGAELEKRAPELRKDIKDGKDLFDYVADIVKDIPPCNT